MYFLYLCRFVELGGGVVGCASVRYNFAKMLGVHQPLAEAEVTISFQDLYHSHPDNHLTTTRSTGCWRGGCAQA